MVKLFVGVGADPAGQVTASFPVPRRARSEGKNILLAKVNYFQRKMLIFGKKGDPILGAMFCQERSTAASQSTFRRSGSLEPDSISAQRKAGSRLIMVGHFHPGKVWSREPFVPSGSPPGGDCRRLCIHGTGIVVFLRANKVLLCFSKMARFTFYKPVVSIFYSS